MKNATTSVKTVLASENCPMLVLVELDFAGGTVQCCNAGYSFDWNGHTWLGLGQVGSINAIQEGKDLQMYGCVLNLTGIDSSLVSLSLDPTEYQGRMATIWLAPLDSSYQILADPIITFQGIMDVMPITMGDTATISLSIESKLIDWERPRARRYNHEDQISEFPEDMGMQYIPQMVEKELVWGRAA